MASYCRSVEAPRGGDRENERQVHPCDGPLCPLLMHENRLIHRPACFCCSWYDKEGDYLRHAANESTRAPLTRSSLSHRGRLTIREGRFRLSAHQRGSHERRIGCRRREDRVCLGFSSAPKGLSDSRHPIRPSGVSPRTDRTSYRTNQRANHPKIKCQIPVIGYFASQKENL